MQKARQVLNHSRRHAITFNINFTAIKQQAQCRYNSTAAHVNHELEIIRKQHPIFFTNPAAIAWITNMVQNNEHYVHDAATTQQHEKPNFKRIQFPQADPSSPTQSFTRCSGGDYNPNEPNRFDYVFFHNAKTMHLKAIVYFGKHLEGHKNITHGGAVATIIDTCMGNNLYFANFPCVTANLSVNFRMPLGLGTMTTVDTQVTNIEKGKKVTLVSTVKLLSNDQVCADATSLWIAVDPKTLVLNSKQNKA